MATKRKRVAIYARVSTDDQTVENQRRELQAVARRHGWNVVQILVDRGISGAKGRDKRPGFDALCKGVARREFDMVAAWSVDRLGRSLRDLITFLGELHGKSVDLYLHVQGLDTSTPAGRAMFGMLSVFADYERAMIQERVKAGMQRAKVQGTRSGKPIGRPPIDPAIEQRILERRAAGDGMLKIARQLGIGTGTVQRVVADQAA